MKLFYLSLALIFFSSAYKICADEKSRNDFIALGDPFPTQFMEDIKTHEDQVFLEKAGRYVVVYYIHVMANSEPVEVIFSYNSIELPTSYCTFDKIQFKAKSFIVESRTDNSILKIRVISNNADQIYSGMIYVMKADLLPGIERNGLESVSIPAGA
jgi:hypothetical protein